MSVPMIGLVEQRCITPFLTAYLSGSANPTAILAHLFLLAWSLPRRICAFLGGVKTDDGNQQSGTNATAKDGDEEDAGAGADANTDVKAATEAAHKTMRIMTLLGRALAAKEAIGKKINIILAPFRKAQDDVANAKKKDSSLGDTMAVVRFKHKMDSKKSSDVHAAPSEEAVGCDAG